MQDTVIAIWKTVTRSFFSKSACKMYPVQPPVFYDRTRGHIQIDAPKCIVCTLCDKKCPTGAIVVDKANNTWAIDRFRCIICNACVEACKPGALSMVNQYTGPTVANQIESVAVTPPKKKKKPDSKPAEPAPAEPEPKTE